MGILWWYEGRILVSSEYVKVKFILCVRGIHKQLGSWKPHLESKVLALVATRNVSLLDKRSRYQLASSKQRYQIPNWATNSDNVWSFRSETGVKRVCRIPSLRINKKDWEALPSHSSWFASSNREAYHGFILGLYSRVKCKISVKVLCPWSQACILLIMHSAFVPKKRCRCVNPEEEIIPEPAMS